MSDEQRTDGANRSAPCPTCKSPAVFVYNAYYGREFVDCWYCYQQRERHRKACIADLGSRFPGLSPRVRSMLVRHFDDGGIPAILAATDDDLLDINQFGPKMLAEFRDFWPTPNPPVVKVLPTPEQFWSQRHDVLALIGG